jgi:Zn-dependent peptidase ImmA (M78 family)
VSIEREGFSHKQAAGLGEKMSQSFSLGARPASSLVSVLEEAYGVKIWYEDLGRDGSALATIGTFGPAILINAREPRWRRNFSVAHEVFHLLTWNALPAELLGKDENIRTKVEAWANSFAAALLLPAGMVDNAVSSRLRDGKIAIAELIDIARQFDVSTDALLWRVTNLGRLRKEVCEQVLMDTDVQNLDAERRRDDWDAPSIPPARFVRLGHLAYVRGDIGIKRLADLLGVGVAEVKDKLGKYGLPTEAGLIDGELQTAAV